MSALLQIGLTNAATATGLAVLAALAGRVLRRPALTRALWVLVLLKLLTPPLWHVQVPRPGIAASNHVLPVVRDIEPAPPAIDEAPLNPENVADASQDAPADVPNAKPPAHARRAPWQQAIRLWPALATILWLSGTAVHLVLLTISIARLRQLARSAEPVDPTTRQRARELAAQLGLRRCPDVSFVNGPLSPMLCAIGTAPRLLLPRDLWDRLDDRQRDTVLTHELAHLRRRDHWVRMLEVTAAALYWWHPVVWYARHAVREASEQCCDAWVLWALPRSAASYASALIEAIDFISTARPAVPALASGMGQFTDLKRRLVMIKQGRAAKKLSWPGFTGICAVAGVLLPMAPGFGQVATESTPPAVAAGIAPAAEVAPGSTPANVASVTVLDGTSAVEVEGADNAGTSARGIESARREVERARAQLARAEERLARLEGRQAGRQGRGGGVGYGSAGFSAGSTAQFERGRAGAASADEHAAAIRLGNIVQGDQQQRLDALENQVREILNELRQMKREQRGRSQSSGEKQ